MTKNCAESDFEQIQQTSTASHFFTKSGAEEVLGKHEKPVKRNASVLYFPVKRFAASTRFPQQHHLIKRRRLASAFGLDGDGKGGDFGEVFRQVANVDCTVAFGINLKHAGIYRAGFADVPKLIIVIRIQTRELVGEEISSALFTIHERGGCGLLLGFDGVERNHEALRFLHNLLHLHMKSKLALKTVNLLQEQSNAFLLIPITIAYGEE